MLILLNVQLIVLNICEKYLVRNISATLTETFNGFMCVLRRCISFPADFEEISAIFTYVVAENGCDNEGLLLACCCSFAIPIFCGVLGTVVYDPATCTLCNLRALPVDINKQLLNMVFALKGPQCFLRDRSEVIAASLKERF